MYDGELESYVYIQKMRNITILSLIFTLIWMGIYLLISIQTMPNQAILYMVVIAVVVGSVVTIGLALYWFVKYLAHKNSY